MRPSFIINNKRIIKRRIIADEFNKYFVSLAPNINKSISPDKNDDILNFKTFMPGSNPNSIFLYDCSAEEISKIMSEFENGKSSDTYTSKNIKNNPTSLLAQSLHNTSTT